MPVWALALTLGLQALTQLEPMLLAAMVAAQQTSQPIADHQNALNAIQNAIAALQAGKTLPKT